MMDIQEYLKYSEHWLTNAPTKKDPVAIARVYAAIAQALAAERQAAALERIADVLEIWENNDFGKFSGKQREMRR